MGASHGLEEAGGEPLSDPDGFRFLAPPPKNRVPEVRPRHNHFTRDVKPEGQCPMCDHLRELGKARDRGT